MALIIDLDLRKPQARVTEMPSLENKFALHRSSHINQGNIRLPMVAGYKGYLPTGALLTYSKDLPYWRRRRLV